LELRGAISSDVKLSDCRLAFKQRSGREGEPLGSPLVSFSRGVRYLSTPFFDCLDHARAAQAQQNGRFAEEIVPVTARRGKEVLEIIQEEHPRPTTTMEQLTKLRPAFRKDGSVTAGNSSGVNDGAAAIIIASGNRSMALVVRALRHCPSGSRVGSVDLGRFRTVSTRAREGECELGTLAIGKRCQERISATGWAW
jgi:hypothetical protein